MNMKFSDLRQAGREGRLSVHLHAFQTLPSGDQEYTDDEAKADGYCTYIRVKTPDDPQQPFDTSHELDHATLESAQATAQGQAWALLGADAGYNHD